MIICSAHFSAYRKIKADNHKLILSLECKIKTLDKGSHQKKVKKFHNKCELSPKMENPLFISLDQNLILQWRCFAWSNF